MHLHELPTGTHELLALVARRYFVEDRTKLDIARELGLSRFKVARLLDQARDSGVVTITVTEPDPIDHELSTRLRDHFGLREAVVVRADEAASREIVGAAAAHWLERSLSQGEILGLGWGRTLASMVDAIRSMPAVTVVQLCGSVGSHFTGSPVELVRQTALASGGRAYPVYAPLLVDNAETAAALRRQPDIAAALAQYDSVTTAVLSVGSWDPPSSQLREWMDPIEREELLRRGVRAEISALFLGDDGELVGLDYAERCLSITAEQLRRVPQVAAVAGGANKARAVRAAAAARLLTVIVTDVALAEAVMALPPVVAAVNR